MTRVRTDVSPCRADDDSISSDDSDTGEVVTYSSIRPLVVPWRRQNRRALADDANKSKKQDQFNFFSRGLLAKLKHLRYLKTTHLINSSELQNTSAYGSRQRVGPAAMIAYHSV